MTAQICAQFFCVVCGIVPPLAVSTTSLGLAMLLCDNGHVYFPMRLKDSRDV